MIYCYCDENGNSFIEPRFTLKVSKENYLLIEKFSKQKKLEGCSELTLQYYSDILKILSNKSGKKFEMMKTYDIRNFMSEYQENRKITNHSLDNIRRVYSTFFSWLEEENYIIKSPMKKIHRIKGDVKVQLPFTEEEIVYIKDACKTIREKAIIDFLYSSGVRVSELCRLDISDISLETREGIVFGKGSKERIIYFDASTKIHLEKYLEKRYDKNAALFVTTNEPYNRLTKSGVEYLVSKIGKRAGIEKCHPHRFRRTLATRLINRNVPVEQVQSILGHEKIDTTMIYAQVNKSNVKVNHMKYA